jgi:hypothetical protein
MARLYAPRFDLGMHDAASRQHTMRPDATAGRPRKALVGREEEPGSDGPASPHAPRREPAGPELTEVAP